MTKHEPPKAPGRALREMLGLMGMSQRELGEIMKRPQPWISDVVQGRRPITVRSATELAAALGTSAGYWLAMRDRYQLWLLAQESPHTRHLDEIRNRAKARGL